MKIFDFLYEKEEGYDAVPLAATLMFCCYVLTWFLQVGNRIDFLGSIRIEFLCAILLILISLISGLKLRLANNPIFYVVIVLIVLMIIQIPLSYVPSHSWDIFYNRVIKFSFMAFFIVIFVKSPRGLIFFLAAFMLACAKMGQEGLVGQITGSMVWENQGIMRLHGSTSLYMHPNSFSGMAIGTLPFIIYLYDKVPLSIKIFFIFMVISSINIILHTGSRTGYVAFIGLLLLVFFRSKNKFKLFFVGLTLVLITVNFTDAQYKGRFESIFTGKEAAGNSSGTRLQIMQDAWDVFVENPFGVGVGAFPAVRIDRFGRFQDIHCLYLEVATNLGIQGFIVFIVFVYKILKTLILLSRKIDNDLYRLDAVNFAVTIDDHKIMMKYNRHIKDLELLKATSNAVFVYISVRLILGLFGQDLYEIYWWVGAGLAIAIFNIYGDSSRKTDEICRLSGVC